MKAAGADFILVAAHSGTVTMNTLRMGKMKVTKLLVSKVMLLRQGILCGFPKWRWYRSFMQLPGVDDVNGLINGKPVYGCEIRRSRHLWMSIDLHG